MHSHSHIQIHGTRQQVAEMYAFLPREAVTRFLMSCSDCQKRMHLQYNNNGTSLGVSSSSQEDVGVKASHHHKAVTVAAKINRLMMREEENNNRTTTSPGDSCNDTDDDADEEEDDADDESFVPHSRHTQQHQQHLPERRLEIVMDVNENQIDSLHIPKPGGKKSKAGATLVAMAQRRSANLSSNGVKNCMQGKKRGFRGSTTTAENAATTGKSGREEPVNKKTRVIGNHHPQQQQNNRQADDVQDKSQASNGESIESQRRRASEWNIRDRVTDTERGGDQFSSTFSLTS